MYYAFAAREMFHTIKAVRNIYFRSILRDLSTLLPVFLFFLNTGQMISNNDILISIPITIMIVYQVNYLRF